MSFLIHSSDVYKETQLNADNRELLHCEPIKDRIGSLPTLFTKDGLFNHEANSYFFFLKAIKRAKDLSPCAQALQAYYQFLESNDLLWDHFPPVTRLKPTYLFRAQLLKEVKNGKLAFSTASIRMNHIVNYYKWLMHDGYLIIKNEKEAPFKIEFVSVKKTGMLSHISPTFTVPTSDLRIKVPRDASTRNIRTLTPLSQDSLTILTQYLLHASEELRLQVLISIDTGMRIQEIATLSTKALDTKVPLAESIHRYELFLSPQSTGIQTKFQKQRQIEISSKLLNVLNEYLISERRIRRIAKLNAKLEYLSDNSPTLKQKTAEALELCKKFEPVFVSEQGNPVSAKSIEARWTELRTIIKKEHPSFKYRFHDLRSTYGTYRLNDLLEAKLPIVECMELLMSWMGHNNESTTWKYLRYLERKEVFKVKFGILDSIMHEALGNDND
ncbi:tyrosine-type recombinase/integrase [Aeromonas enteropelogenes]|uniref:tyrosine-type recombinase/integrase n=1 Tax=Aeromonas enteropelogenes TaxID=29489 RepID=UPI003BA208F3